MPRPRFTLRVALTVTAAIALLLGLSQWRQRSIRREIGSLAQSGCEVFTRVDPTDQTLSAGLREEWIDRLWQRLPSHANISATDLGIDRLQIGQETLGRDAFEAKVISLHRRLEVLGVEQIKLLINGRPLYSLPKWLMDFKERSGIDIYFGDSGTSSYGK